MIGPDELLTIFSESVVSVFKTVADLEVRHIETSVKADYLCENDLSGILEFSGHAQGVAALCLPADLATSISRKLTGFSEQELGEGVIVDAARELVNQIVGSAKAQLEGTPYYFALHTPRSEMGEAQPFTADAQAPCIRLSFETQGTPLSLLLAITAADGVPLSPAEKAEPLSLPSGRDEGEVLVIDDDMVEVVDGFVVESEEMIEQLDQDLVELDSAPENMELVNSVFRALHTLKGNSLALGFEKMNTMVHRTEDVVRKVRDGEMKVSPEMMDVVLEGVDMVKALLEDIKERRKSTQDLEPVIVKLRAVLEGSPPAAASQEKAGPLEIDDEMVEVVDGFVVECEEMLEKLDEDLVELDKAPENMDLVNSIFRALHTMKGNSLALGFDKMNTMVHRTEDVVRKVRDGEMKVSPEMMDVVLEGVDVVKTLLGDVKERRKSTQDLEPVIAKLMAVLEGKLGGGEQKLQIDEDMQEIVDGFVVESEELLQKLDEELVALEEVPEDAERIGAVFRGLHTLKGNSRALGFDTLEKLVHRTEDIVRKVRDGKARIRPEMMDVILRAVDQIKGLLADIKRRVVSTVDLSDILTELGLIFEEKYEDLAARREKAKKPAQASAPPKKTASSTIRVDLKKLDTLMGAAGELVLNKNRLLNLVQRLEQGGEEMDINEALAAIYAQMSILVNDLQSGVMTTRMQPVSKVFNKYPRVVRDLSRELGKQIELTIRGEETELDNTIIEEIGDPLIHLVRNSCDHGVETPQERTAAGKDPKGHVELKAYQEGNYVVIQIQDDGKGIDAEVIKQKGIAKGLVTEEQAMAMSKGDILSLIFAPGFSTAEKVTAVSGRGVGMDVVKTNIAKLNGIIDLDSEKGKGTTLKIRLPLTMAVMTVLEVEVGEEKYLLPQESIVEAIRVPPRVYPSIVAEKKFLFRDRYLNPLVDLAEFLGVRRNGAPQPTQGYVVVIGEVEQRTGVLVDNVIQQHEVLLKPLGGYMDRFSISAIGGATIMGDGTVQLILNSSQLLQARDTVETTANA